jgi:SAM-dependent methyltransferase
MTISSTKFNVVAMDNQAGAAIKGHPDDLRFQFGNNWNAFLNRLDNTRIAEAERSLQTLLQRSRLDGLSFLDIGSGSGLFSLAARRLGARVHSFDYDTASVACTATLRKQHFPDDGQWTVEHGSVLNLTYMEALDKFDIVYSWGVLHHTGAMLAAIEHAASRVADGGIFAFALYRRTALCWAWTLEKRWYVKASPANQAFARWIYVTAVQLAFRVQGRDFKNFTTSHHGPRGMDFHIDVHDWMGGYPYESIRPTQVSDLMIRLGFEHLRSVTRNQPIGIFGSGCDEYVYRRVA